MKNKGNTATLIGIAGASGSGKTFLTQKLEEKFDCHSIVHLLADHYYKDQSHLTMSERARRNYDHPDAIDFQLMTSQLNDLRQGKTIAHPLYDFSIHNRKAETVSAGPAKIVLLDGILIFAIADLCDMLELKIFVDTPPDLCFIRRLCRDTRERGRTVESVIDQYLSTVRPMFLKYVEPTKAHADLVVSGVGDMAKDVQKIVKMIQRHNY